MFFVRQKFMASSQLSAVKWQYACRFFLVALVTLSLWLPARSLAQLLLDVVPAAQTGETQNDAEVSLSIRGDNVAILSFTDPALPWPPWEPGGPVAAPYWFSAGGGAPGTWFWNVGAYPRPLPQDYGPLDQTLGFNPAGDVLYSVFLSKDSDTIWWRTHLFGNGPPVALAGPSVLLLPPNGTLVYDDTPDQPFLSQRSVTTVGAGHPLGAGDVVFYGINDISVAPNTATLVRVTPGVGRPAPLHTRLEVAGTAGQNGPPIRAAVAGDGATVYAVFQRWNPPLPQSPIRSTDGQIPYVVTARGAKGLDLPDVNGDIVIRRSLNLGIDGFVNAGYLAAGNNVAAGIDIPMIGGTMLGTERLGSDLSIAVAPRNPAFVYVAYAEAVGGVPILNVVFNAAGGVAGTPWVIIGTFTHSALPALAVADNGTIGILYAAYDVPTGRFIYHFAQSPQGAGLRFRDPGPRGQFVLAAPDINLILEDFLDGVVGAGQPRYGDYHFLEAVGNTFYGTFAGSNQFDGADPIQFPNGVVFQRTDRVWGGVGPGWNGPSVDPFFMIEAALPPPPPIPALTQWGGIALVVLLIASAIFIMLRRKKATMPA